MDRMEFHGLAVFLAIAKAGTLRAAARDLKVNPPTVSHQLKVFEDLIGTPLFVRSTRSVTLTDAGKELLAGSQHLVQALDEVLDGTRQLGHTTGGTLRINLPYRAWQLVIAQQLKAFREAYPNIQLEFSLEERLTDIIQDGFHAGIRLGDHLQDGMLRRKLCGTLRVALVASPEYLAQNGTPKTVEDLAAHHCIGYRGPQSGQVQPWHFVEKGEQKSFNPQRVLVFNDMRTAVEAAELGYGLAWSLKDGVQQQLNDNTLCEVLPKCSASRPGFYIYYPKQIRSLPVLRAFLDHFAM